MAKAAKRHVDTGASTNSVNRPSISSSLLLIGFGVAVTIRVFVGGPAVAQSSAAGLTFAACLLLLTAVYRPVTVVNRNVLLLGLAGGLVLCVPSVIALLWGAQRHVPQGNYLQWGIIVSIVAFLEEAFLRGSLFSAVTTWKGEMAALAITSVAFALLHVPLYGWQVVPLDLTVGLCFGCLRLYSGTYVTSGIAHVVADLAGWWLR